VKKPNFSVKNLGNGAAEILIYDIVGPSEYGYVSAKDVIDQAKALGSPASLTVRLNSPGGDVYNGLTIYNWLIQCGAKVTMMVDGIAASIASVIAMAGDTIKIPENGMFMIHEPMVLAMGGRQELRAEADRLDKINQQVIDIYVSRTKASSDTIAAAMAAETWYTGAEALAAGFATELLPNKSIAACCDPGRFKNVPEWAAALMGKPSDPPPPEGKKEEEKPAEQPPAGTPMRDLARKKLQVLSSLRAN
jgi:ATP-dependent protease ClpP protease subunit